MLIVGQEKVGKTSLLLCLKSKTHRPPPQNTTLISTDGVDITSFYLSVALDSHKQRGSTPGVQASASNEKNVPSPAERLAAVGGGNSSGSLNASPNAGSPLAAASGTSPSVSSPISAHLESQKSSKHLWSLREKSREVDVEFTTWDFAGQKVYATTHEYFMGSASLYLLVWDLRYPILQNIQFWLRSIRHVQWKWRILFSWELT